MLEIRHHSGETPGWSARRFSGVDGASSLRSVVVGSCNEEARPDFVRVAEQMTCVEAGGSEGRALQPCEKVGAFE